MLLLLSGHSEESMTEKLKKRRHHSQEMKKKDNRLSIIMQPLFLAMGYLDLQGQGAFIGAAHPNKDLFKGL